VRLKDFTSIPIRSEYENMIISQSSLGRAHLGDSGSKVMGALSKSDVWSVPPSSSVVYILSSFANTRLAKFDLESVEGDARE